MTAQIVLLIGLRSDCVDFAKWPQFSVEKLEEAFAKVIEDLTNAGYRATWCLTDRGKTAVGQVKHTIATEQPDLVLIGAGVRTDPDHFLLFETLINIIHADTPQAKIAFNQLPYDTVEAVHCWLPA